LGVFKYQSYDKTINKKILFFLNRDLKHHILLVYLVESLLYMSNEIK